MSLLNAARLKASLCHSNEDVISAFGEATAACPARAEALHGAAQFCRTSGLYELGYTLAKRGLGLAPPDDALFPEDWIYEYGLRDELAVCAYWTCRYAECRDACDRLMSEGKIPVEHHARILHNRRVAIAGLGRADARCSTRDALKQEASS